MKKLLAIIFSIAFALPAFAEESDCGPYKAPSEGFVQAAAQHHPNLSPNQHVVLGGMYETMMGTQAIAENASLNQVDRDLAKRTFDVMVAMVSIQAMTYEKLPEFQLVLSKMQMEQDAGLIKVSDELLPEVRLVATTMIVIGQTWADLSVDTVYITADRFVAIANSDDPVPGVVDALDRAMCALEASTDLMTGVAEVVPTAVSLAFVENLYY